MIKLNKMGSTKLRNIENLEKKYSLSLPIDYKEFLLSTNGGTVEINQANQLAIDGLSEKVVIGVLYGVDTGFEAANIDFWTDKFKNDLLSETIVIGDSIMNGLFVMICSGEMKGLYYWDDSYHFDTSNDENNIYWIASTFTDFMKMFG